MGEACGEVKSLMYYCAPDQDTGCTYQVFVKWKVVIIIMYKLEMPKRFTSGQCSTAGAACIAMMPREVSHKDSSPDLSQGARHLLNHQSVKKYIPAL